jgi:citrate lyase beta subunit
MYTAGDKLLPYRVGALMYVPALNAGIGEKICAGAYPELDSLAFCLEDALTDSRVGEAETQLVKTLAYITKHRTGKLPLLFVRVRNYPQFKRLAAVLGDMSNLLTGLIFPKFDLAHAAEYCSIMGDINAARSAPLYFMPVIETESVMKLGSRKRTLLGIREVLDGCREIVLNVRVGAMDFCRMYGFRRGIGNTIYDIGVVRDMLTDILTVFSDSYVVSAPVWEYFCNSDGDDGRWALGLENELRLDIANGFIGKTVIHPSQLPIVRKWLMPVREDVDDAKAVLEWKDEGLGVAKSVNGNRMNEVATHVKWAQKILMLSEIYGARLDGENIDDA